MFEEIDENKIKYGISDYSIRCSTLEEVFIKIGEDESKAEDEEFQSQIDSIEILETVPERKRSGFCRLFVAQVLMNLQSNWAGKTTALFLAFFVIFNLVAIIFGRILI